MESTLYFDIVVVGGGHAGLEAAWISSKLELKVALVSLKEVPLGSAPCNPSIGGLAKGQVVREIDALGGLMGKLADSAAIHYRTLNESKGHAVQSTRVQIDKKIYSENAEKIISTAKNLQLIRDNIIKIERGNNGNFLLQTEEKVTIEARKIILTTGTFLNGKLHTGEIQAIGGRHACPSGPALSKLFSEMPSHRFKTGTPARIKAHTVDSSALIPQPSESTTRNFHLLNDQNSRQLPQVTCFLTETTPETMAIIRANKHRAPLFNGQIQGIGPRYCPSIEDKAFRYPDRDVHHLFLEPEGLDPEAFYYPNGISTALPSDVQLEFIRTIPGLHNAEIGIYGYAVEYDVIETSKLKITLEYKDIPGLYCAGQINGTSGYEEAAGQGIVAGINASFSLMKRENFVLDRHSSYIGVMIEDLVSNLRDEPYRLFTSRAENRLYMRDDNTIQRMYNFRKKLCLKEKIDDFQAIFIKEFDILSKLCDETVYWADIPGKKHFLEMTYGPLTANIFLTDLLRRTHLNPAHTLQEQVQNFGCSFNPDVVRTVAISKKYDGYIARLLVETEKTMKFDKKRINWEELVESKNISTECRQRIRAIKPETFSQLKKIDGIRAATLQYVAGNLV
ncbi:MAG: tRNA uridine-5-carboxymethylaminomethyl(34) synthesis enzyme MnmG [Pseudomonadota bacterium]